MVAATFVALAHNFTLSGPWAAALAGSSLLAAGLDAVAKLLSSSQATDAELVRGCSQRRLGVCGQGVCSRWRVFSWASPACHSCCCHAPLILTGNALSTN